MLSGVSCSGALRFPSAVIGVHWEKNTENFTKLILTFRFDFYKTKPHELRACGRAGSSPGAHNGRAALPRAQRGRHGPKLGGLRASARLLQPSFLLFGKAPHGHRPISSAIKIYDECNWLPRLQTLVHESRKDSSKASLRTIGSGGEEQSKKRILTRVNMDFLHPGINYCWLLNC